MCNTEIWEISGVEKFSYLAKSTKVSHKIFPTHVIDIFECELNIHRLQKKFLRENFA